MRFAHISDIHAGKRLHGYDLTEDLEYVLNQIVEKCTELKVDALLVAGDLYDSSRPPASAVALIDRFLTKLHASGIVCVAIAGNHDSGERVHYASQLLKSQDIHLTGFLDGAPEPVELTDTHGTVKVWSLPFVRPADVQAALGATCTTYTEALAAVVEHLNLDPNTRHVAVAHQFVTSGGVSAERSESEVNVGGLDNVEVSAFEPFAYVALGHLHKASQVGRPEVRYSGAPLAYSVAEGAMPKVMVVADLGAPGKPVQIEEVPLTPLHAVRIITGPLADLIKPDVLDQAPADDYVYARLTNTEPQLDDGARLRDAYPHLLGYEYLTSSQAQSAPQAPAATQERMIDLFTEFYQLQQGEKPTNQQAELAQTLLAQAEERA